MSSTAELRARIDELSSAIETQIQVLRDLETRRIYARRELNHIVDPIARLPLEISSDIFLSCLPDSPLPDCHTAPLLFLNICHFWSAIALATPALWATVRFEFPDEDSGSSNSQPYLEAWFDRSKNHPLSISLHGYFTDMFAIVKRHASRVQTLDLSVPGPESLEHIIAPFPSLKTLKVVDTVRNWQASSLRGCMKALHAAPMLVKCELVTLSFGTNLDVVPLTHPCLRHLRLGQQRQLGIDEGRGRDVNSAWILKHLTLPALETLLISDLDIPSDEFHSFLARSSPLLWSLDIAGEGSNMGDGAFFRLVPSLTDLTLDFWDWTLDAGVLEGMATDAEFLPNLHDLTIHCRPNGSQHGDLLQLLTARRASRHCSRPQSIRLVFEPTWGEEPKDEPDIVAALLQLAQDGIHIHGDPRYTSAVGYLLRLGPSQRTVLSGFLVSIQSNKCDIILSLDRNTK